MATNASKDRPKLANDKILLWLKYGIARLLVAHDVHKDYFFVQNPINRHSISARQNLKANADGSVDLYIQNESPGADKESNWLPAPKDKFILMMRLYWPKTTQPSILDGSWQIPEVKAVE